jgi:hypothetical protein
MLSSLRKAHKAGKLQFFGDHAGLADRKAFAAFLRPWATADWVVYARIYSLGLDGSGLRD